MLRPNPLADPFLRRSFTGVAVAGVVVTGLLAVVAALEPTATAAWLAVGAAGVAYANALFMTLIGYRLGWYARARDEIGRTGGHWLAYPVDADGVPTTAPVTGRLVLDEPMEMERS